jgi:hypothetical protein
MPNDLTPQIQQTAAQPANASRDGLSAANQPIQDLIAADKYLKANQAAQQVPWGIRFAKIITPGNACP